MKIFGTNVDVSCTLMVDHIGNICLKYKDNYYYVYVDDARIDFVHLKNVQNLRKQLNCNNDIISIVKRQSKKIIASDETLRGKTMKYIDDMQDTDKYTSDFSSYDSTFVERMYYNLLDVDTCCDDEDTFDDTLPFYVNLMVGDSTDEIEFADILMEHPASHDTIVMRGNCESTNVCATIERKDGFCARRLTIYTDGFMKINNVGDKITYFKVVIDDKDNFFVVLFANNL